MHFVVLDYLHKVGNKEEKAEETVEELSKRKEKMTQIK